MHCYIFFQNSTEVTFEHLDEFHHRVDTTPFSFAYMPDRRYREILLLQVLQDCSLVIDLNDTILIAPHPNYSCLAIEPTSSQAVESPECCPLTPAEEVLISRSRPKSEDR